MCFKVYQNISHQNYFFNKYFGLTKQKYTCRGAYFFSITCNCLCIKTQFCLLFIYWNVNSSQERNFLLAQTHTDISTCKSRKIQEMDSNFSHPVSLPMNFESCFQSWETEFSNSSNNSYNFFISSNPRISKCFESVTGLSFAIPLCITVSIPHWRM